MWQILELPRRLWFRINNHFEHAKDKAMLRASPCLLTLLSWCRCLWKGADRAMATESIPVKIHDPDSGVKATWMELFWGLYLISSSISLCKIVNRMLLSRPAMAVVSKELHGMDFSDHWFHHNYLCSGIGNTKAEKTALKLCRGQDEDAHQRTKVPQKLWHRYIQVSVVRGGKEWPFLLGILERLHYQIIGEQSQIRGICLTVSKEEGTSCGRDVGRTGQPILELRQLRMAGMWAWSWGPARESIGGARISSFWSVWGAFLRD